MVDNMLLEEVNLPRSNRDKICKEEFYNSPNKCYLSTGYPIGLFNSKQVKLEVSMRKINTITKPNIIGKKRKRVKTLFPQLYDQFIIRRNFTKLFEGFKTRILSKLALYKCTRG